MKGVLYAFMASFVGLFIFIPLLLIMMFLDLFEIDIGLIYVLNKVFELFDYLMTRSID